LAFAQDNTQVTRSAVKSDLQQMEQAGYTPAEDRTTYPAKTQAAEQRVQDERGVAATSYGPSMSGTSASGIRAQTGPSDSNHTIYFGH
jgi:ribose 5-phosphate isomerase RpiB